MNFFDRLFLGIFLEGSFRKGLFFWEGFFLKIFFLRGDLSGIGFF